MKNMMHSLAKHDSCLVLELGQPRSNFHIMTADVSMCICQGAPVTADSLASNYSHVSFELTVILPLKRTTYLNGLWPVPCAVR